MARVVFQSDSPIKALSGTYCGVVYKTLSGGRTTAHLLPMPSPEEIEREPSARATAIICDCVWEIQRAMDVREAVKRYSAIRKRIEKIYAKACDLYPNDIEGNTKLTQSVLDAYRQSRRVLPSRKVEAGKLGLT